MIRFVLFVSVVAIALWAVGPANTIAQEVAAVEIRDFAFGPAVVMVAVGGTVRWTNHDDFPHSVATEGSQLIASPFIAPGQQFSFTFRQAGSFSYRCGVHPTMLGQVIVQ